LTTANNAARHKKTHSQQCGSAAAVSVFPIVALKNGAAESAVKVHGTPVCLEFLQQLSTLTGEAAALLSKSKLLDDEPVSWSCRIL
jgi:hypothetical protein